MSLTKMVSNLPSDLIHAIAKVVIFVLVIAGLCAACYLNGRQSIQVKWDKERLEWQIAEEKRKGEKGKIEQVIITEVKEVVREIKIKGDTIYKEVPAYVTIEDNGRCDVSDGFVSLWNDANRLPGT